MDITRLDAIALALAAPASRRLAGRILAGLGLTGLVTPAYAAASLAAGKKGKKRKPKKPKRNAFGCVDAGEFCKNSGQCCSGMCLGKQGKGKCQPHDTGFGTCEPVALGFCAADDGGLVAGIPCTTTGDGNGLCFTTTGNAPYCSASQPHTACGADPTPCTKDSDCQAACGPQAACIQCPACEETFPGVKTVCAGPEADSCPP